MHQSRADDVPPATRAILITGCSSGIGRAAALTLHGRGWRVFATARRPEDLAALQADGVTPVHLELADPASIAACAQHVLEATGGRIDALFNNAAYGQTGAVEDLTADVLRAQFEVNVIGTHDLTRRLIPAMRAQGHGRIVQCSSVLGLISGPFRGAYSSSKFALEALSDAMRHELHGTGIHVSLIEPGPIRTNFVVRALEIAERTLPLETSPHSERYRTLIAGLRAGGRQRFKLEPEAVVSRLIHALESPRPKIRYYVTTPTHLAVAARRVLPGRALDWFARRS